MTGYRSPRGLTLIEIVILVVALGVLAAFMLLPTLSINRGSARQVSCLSNLKQLAMSSHLYADESVHNGRFPDDGIGACGSMNLLYDKYVKDYRLWKCPGNPDEFIKLNTIKVAPMGPNLTKYMTNYGYDRRHTQGDDEAVFLSDMGPGAVAGTVSKNHSKEKSIGQNMVDCSGAGRWIDSTKHTNKAQVSEDIFTDDSANPALGISGDSWIRND